LCKERTEEHVRGHPKDHTTNMQFGLCGRVKTRRHGNTCDTESHVTPKTRRHGNPCDTEFRVFQKTRNSVCNIMPCDSEEHEFPCVSGKTPKTRKHGNPLSRRKPSWRRIGGYRGFWIGRLKFVGNSRSNDLKGSSGRPCGPASLNRKCPGRS
jgi:hypothetical protein